MDYPKIIEMVRLQHRGAGQRFFRTELRMNGQFGRNRGRKKGELNSLSTAETLFHPSYAWGRELPS